MEQNYEMSRNPLSIEKEKKFKMKSTDLCIDACMDPRYMQLRAQEFERFGKGLMVLYQDLSGFVDVGLLSDGANELQKLIDNLPTAVYLDSYTNKLDSISCNNLMFLLLSIRQFIEYLPLIKYFVHNNILTGPLSTEYLPTALQNISFPSIIRNNKLFSFAVHLASGYAGVAFLSQEALDKAMIIATLGTLKFGVMLAASHYLNEQKQEIITLTDKLNNGFEITRYCMNTMFAYTMPGIVICALAQFGVPVAECSVTDLGLKISISGAECYSFYKTTQESRHQTITDMVIPFIADSVAVAFAIQHMSFDIINFSVTILSLKQDLALLASVAAVDYLSRLAIDFVSDDIKDSYIDPSLLYAFDIVKRFWNMLYEAN
jgi:hypothetical protein